MPLASYTPYPAAVAPAVVASDSIHLASLVAAGMPLAYRPAYPGPSALAGAGWHSAKLALSAGAAGTPPGGAPAYHTDEEAGIEAGMAAAEVEAGIEIEGEAVAVAAVAGVKDFDSRVGKGVSLAAVPTANVAEAGKVDSRSHMRIEEGLAVEGIGAEKAVVEVATQGSTHSGSFDTVAGTPPEVASALPAVATGA